MTNLQIWECNVSKDDAIATVVDKLDTKSAPTLPKPEECYNYVLEEIREEEIREMEEAQGKKEEELEDVLDLGRQERIFIGNFVFFG